ncbi:MAG: helix-turn-helix transcriptional regulator [Clostridiales bacterium]|nr:helix-turn-helix transcriptional regulator [Clostridiales bacterium]
MNRQKLEEERRKKNFTIDELCSEIGISRSAYYRKTNGISEFTQSEIEKLVKILDLKSPMGIFLTIKCLK